MSLRYLTLFSNKKNYLHSSVFIFDIPVFEGDFNSNHPTIQTIFLELGIYLRKYEEMNEL